MVYNKETAVLGDAPPLAALFDPANQVVLRPRSALTAMDRLLEIQGKLPFPWLEGCTDLDKMTQLWDIVLTGPVDGFAAPGARDLIAQAVEAEQLRFSPDMLIRPLGLATAVRSGMVICPSERSKPGSVWWDDSERWPKRDLSARRQVYFAARSFGSGRMASASRPEWPRIVHVCW